jgi:hypothetical protein
MMHTKDNETAGLLQFCTLQLQQLRVKIQFFKQSNSLE